MVKETIKENKFEVNEKNIAQAENVLLQGGKYVCTDVSENHLLHLEVHKKDSGDNMLVKRHILNHQQDIENKHRDAMTSGTEAKMIY